jgi:F-type H+-transporting ATPase subunit gamma
MTRLADIQAHIASMEALRDIVGAMRSLAGMRVQEAERILPGVRTYARSVAAGILDAFLLIGEPAAPRGGPSRGATILCMAEHGFVGGFNERMLQAAEKTLGNDMLFVLGTRGAAFLAEREHPPDWSYPMPTRGAAAPGAVQRLSDELYRRIARGEIARVTLIHAGMQGGQPGPIRQRQILPVDPASFDARSLRQPPLFNLDPVVLLEQLMAEYVFALLMEGIVESNGGENAARLAAMESAHDNVAQKLEGLQRQARDARQSEITTELLDLVTASMALPD